MLTMERAVMRGGALVLAVLLAVAVFTIVENGTQHGWQAAIDLTLQVLAGAVIAGVGGVLIGLVVPAVARRATTTREGAYFRIVIADGHLRMSSPGRRATQLVDADLTSVRHLHWYVSAFSRQQTVRVTLWDRPSTFTLKGIDVHPDAPDARELGWFRAPDLLLQPDQHRRFVAHFEPLVLSGQVTSTIDLETLQPTQGNADHTAPGWVAFEDEFIYSPHLAETERQLRSQQ